MEESRKHLRHSRQLRAAIICEGSGKPVKAYGKTLDVSASGASIVTDCNLANLQPVTVCLLIHPGDQINPPVIVEARSRIVFSIFSGRQGGFRISVEFVKIEGDGAKILQKMMAASPAMSG